MVLVDVDKGAAPMSRITRNGEWVTAMSGAKSVTDGPTGEACRMEIGGLKDSKLARARGTFGPRFSSLVRRGRAPKRERC
jgi:hypothetical protein